MDVIKDLVVDMTNFFAQYASIKPWIETQTPAPSDRERLQSKEERAAETLLPIKVFITPAPKFNQTLRTILQHPLYQLK